MMGTDGGTEQFFLRLVTAFGERGLEQQFAIRPGFAWRDQIAPLGTIHEGYFLRRTPSGLLQAARLRRHIAGWNADAVMAWRAPSARLMPKAGAAAKIVRLGDYPRHLRHFGNLDCIVGNAPQVLNHCRSLGWIGRDQIISNFPPEGGATPVPRAVLSTPQAVPLVCAVGRFFPTKGFDTLLRAIALTDNFWLWLVGDGEQRQELENLARNLGIADRVRMPGWVSNVTDYIAASDVFCLPSRQEPLGNVMLEGWISGRPVVATRSEGPQWAAKDRKDILLVEIDAPERLAHALKEVVEDPALADLLVAGGRETLARQFSKTAVVDAYLRLFEDLLTGDKR